MAVAGRDDRHDARIGDAQTRDPADPQLRVDDGEVVGAHLAGAHLVVVRVGGGLDEGAQLVLGLRVVGGHQLLAPTHGANALVAKIRREILTASTSFSRSLGSPR